MHDNFLMIVPEGWVAIPDANFTVLNHIGESSMQNLIDDQAWADIQLLFVDTLEVPEGQVVGGARMLRSEGLIHVFVLFIPA